MLAGVRPAKVSPQDIESKKFQALQSARIETNKSKALSLKAGKATKLLEQELVEAKDIEAKHIDEHNKATETLEQCQLDYQRVQSTVQPAAVLPPADLESQEDKNKLISRNKDK
eukprot:12615781-Heterocapsa_arctica.AAC.1